MKMRILAILLFALQIGFGQIYINSYRFAVEAPNLLLDDYPGATAAYSLRKLDKDYTGSAIRIRTAGGSETDIGFDGSGNLNTAAITTFCAGTTCTVATWYDQSGNANHATQTTPASQPTIYTGGAVVLVEGNFAIDFDGSNDFLNCSNFTSNNVLTAFAISSTDDNSIIGMIFDNSNNTGVGGGYSHYYRPATGFRTWSQNATYAADGTAITNNTLNVTTQIGRGNSTNDINDFYLNGSLTQTNTGPTTTRTTKATTRIGSSELFGLPLNGKICELIVYNSNQSASRSNIESNINSYYSIY